MLAEAEALGSIGCNSRVEVDDGSTGGNRLEAVLRPRIAGCSETPDRGDPDAPSRAEQPELERSYAAVSRPLPGVLLISLVYNRAFSVVSHVPVATVGSSYEG
eukprot:scaffold50399_cov86-Phaeocystis_antarctica.AAC.4